MKKSNLIKLFSILAIGAMVMMFNTSVLAADNDGNFTQLTLNNSSSNNSNSNASNSNTNNANTNTKNSNANTNNSNKSNNTNNSSIYNNTNLPKTGIEDSIPVAMLVVVFGISAVYAYKKIKDYRNI